MDLGLKVMPGDEAFYDLNENGKLIEALLTHIDDLILAGNAEFIEKKTKMTNIRYFYKLKVTFSRCGFMVF